MWFIPLYSLCPSSVVVAVVENLTVQKKKRQTKGRLFRGVHQLSCSALFKYWASDIDHLNISNVWERYHCPRERNPSQWHHFSCAGESFVFTFRF